MGAPILGLRCSDMAVISSYYIAWTRHNRFAKLWWLPFAGRLRPAGQVMRLESQGEAGAWVAKPKRRRMGSGRVELTLG
jgi:hypothetical protein